MTVPNSTTSVGIPNGTAPKSEASILEALKACNARNFDTLADVALHGVTGEPIDDKTYLMERMIQLTAGLPLHDKASDTLTNKLLSQLWKDLGHPPSSYLGYDFAFRKADGSNNNIMWPHIGQAGQPYARSVRPQKMQGPRPDPGVVFDSVLKRKEFRPHPNKISSVLFYLASIIIHDCFHTSHKDFAISETSSYLDLAPLYGSNEKQQMAVRTLKDGKLKPDCFSDSRVLGFPSGVGVLLIMFNRFHNNVVENLAKIDEGSRFSGILDPNTRRRTGLTPTDKEGQQPKTPEELYDEALFQTGRLITTGLYTNIILQDYVRTILGLNRVDSVWNLDPRANTGRGVFGEQIPEAGGNQVSAEFSLVYRWHSCISQRDEQWTNTLLKSITENARGVDPIKAAAKWADDLAKMMPNERPFDNLKRGADGRFSDDELCKIWTDSVEDIAGAFGAAHVPASLRFVEVLGMIQSRSWNLASLNEFRAYFKLQPHKTFESINSDPYIAGQLEKLYGHPDNVEVYPGIVVEDAKKPMAPGSGLCTNFSISRAILADAVALVRGDRFYTVDYTPNNLTNWGFQTASYDLDVNWGGVLYKLVLNAFPKQIATNSIYAHFPLVIPSENQMILKGLKRDQLYSFAQPNKRPSIGSTSLWTNRIDAFDAPRTVQTHSATRLSFAEAVMANHKWKAITTKFYVTTLERLWAEKQYELGGYQQVDVVADVLNTAHVSFITSVLGIPLSEGKHESILENLSHVFESAFKTDAKPRGLTATVREFTHWLASSVGSGFENANPSTHEEQLGKAALAKMTAANGQDTEKQVWQDVLPTASLMLTSLSQQSAAAVEQALDEKTHLSNTFSAIGVATATQTSPVSSTDSKPENVLAQEVAEIAKKVIIDIIQRSPNVKRVPGPQGTIKRISLSGGEVKYLNTFESDYVAYPLSMKLRWTK